VSWLDRTNLLSPGRYELKPPRLGAAARLTGVRSTNALPIAAPGLLSSSWTSSCVGGSMLAPPRTDRYMAYKWQGIEALGGRSLETFLNRGWVEFRRRHSQSSCSARSSLLAMFWRNPHHGESPM